MINRINKDRHHLLDFEDKILKLLFESKGNILDDEALVDALNETKEATVTTNTRLAESQEAEGSMTANREKYRPVAIRATELFLLVALLPRINSNYQFSLPHFTSIYRSVISKRSAVTEVEDRVQFVISELAVQLYNEVCTALSERDRPVFGFLIAVAIEKSRGQAADDDVTFLMRIRSVASEARSEMDLRDFIQYLKAVHPEVQPELNEIPEIARLRIGDFEMVSSCNC